MNRKYRLHEMIRGTVIWYSAFGEPCALYKLSPTISVKTVVFALMTSVWNFGNVHVLTKYPEQAKSPGQVMSSVTRALCVFVPRLYEFSLCSPVTPHTGLRLAHCGTLVHRPDTPEFIGRLTGGSYLPSRMLLEGRSRLKEWSPTSDRRHVQFVPGRTVRIFRSKRWSTEVNRGKWPVTSREEICFQPAAEQQREGGNPISIGSVNGSREAPAIPKLI